MWRNHVNSIAMSVPLYDLVYRSVNDAYERLHNLTTQMAASGSYVGAEKRRRALQHYVRQTRHQLIQLLVAVRYSKQAAVVERAQAAIVALQARYVPETHHTPWLAPPPRHIASREREHGFCAGLGLLVTRWRHFVGCSTCSSRQPPRPGTTFRWPQTCLHAGRSPLCRRGSKTRPG